MFNAVFLNAFFITSPAYFTYLFNPYIHIVIVSRSMKQFLIILILVAQVLVISSCRKKNSNLGSVVDAMRESGQLVTAEYTLGKIVKASDDKTWYKIGERKILMSMEAQVRAGVNLEQITKKDFKEEGETIAVTLPAAQLFSINIPPDKIKVEYQEIGLLRTHFNAAEREDLLRQAEAQVRRLADSLNIVQTAEDNAALYIRNLLQQTGYQKVEVRFKKPNL